MDAQKLKNLLGFPIQCFEETTSTNAQALLWAKAGAPHGALVTADRQTAGRGRRGRPFFSPQGGLYMSLIVRHPVDLIGGMTTLAAVAVCRALQKRGVELSVKWVNDCLKDGKKVCGILAEGGLQTVPPFVVVGIGLNLAPVVFPADLQDKAAAIFVGPTDLESIAADIALGVLKGLEEMPAHMPEYRERCITLGRIVRFDVGGRTLEGTAEEILNNGTLVVRTQGGPVQLSSGEASVRMPDGRYV